MTEQTPQAAPQPPVAPQPADAGYQQQYAAVGQAPAGQPMQQMQPVTDSGSFGWAVLGFFIPLVGLILFIVWKQTKPKCAKMAGIGALVGVILAIIANVAMFSLVMAAAPYYY